MFERKSLSLPITLGVIMIVLLVLLIVGWVLLSVFGAITDDQRRGLYLALLSIGATSLVFVLVGVVMYLTLSIKAIHLTRRQSNFIDSVTHELKSPIASLKLYLQTLNRRRISPDEQVEFYKVMLEDVERLDSLINHLLDAARVERVLTEKEEVEISGVLHSCAEAVLARYHTPGDVIEFDLVPCIVRAARVDLELIFRNLIDNAVKYAADDPHVEIQVRCESKGRVFIRISDNGCGIPQAERSKMFARFMRLGSELERKKPGTGLGLYIVRTLVHRLGGKIRIHDREQGPGTTFEVQLPGGPPEVENEQPVT